MASLTMLTSQPRTCVQTAKDGTSQALLREKHLTDGTVYDIGGGSIGMEDFQKAILLKKLFWTNDPWTANGVPQRILPTSLLTDKKGYDLWETLTRLPTYYQTDHEIEMFKSHGHEIVDRIAPHTLIIDIGCGDVRKFKPILDQLEASKKPVQYFALDVAKEPLVAAVGKLSNSYKFVKCNALWGSFSHCLDWLENEDSGHPRLYLSLGSFLGNDHYGDSVEVLKMWRDRAMTRETDWMLLTMDGTEDLDVIWQSYHDPQGVFEQFIRNGFEHSNRIMGHTWYRAEDWELIGVLEEEPIMHRFVLKAKRDVTCLYPAIFFPIGTEIDCYECFRYPPALMRRQFAEADLFEMDHWRGTKRGLVQYHLTKNRQGPSPNGYGRW